MRQQKITAYNFSIVKPGKSFGTCMQKDHYIFVHCFVEALAKAKIYVRQWK